MFSFPIILIHGILCQLLGQSYLLIILQLLQDTTKLEDTCKVQYFLQVTLMDIIFADINPKLYLLFSVSKHYYFCSSLKVSVEIHILRTLSFGEALRSVHKPFTLTAVDRGELIRKL